MTTASPSDADRARIRAEALEEAAQIFENWPTFDVWRSEASAAIRALVVAPGEGGPGELPTAVARIMPDGDVEYARTDGARLLVVDERCRHDRVYEVARPITIGELEELIGDSPIGSADDERHAAIAARIEEELGGPPRLSPLPAPPRADKGHR